MARTEARLLTSIWADPDWRALPSVDAQWLYVLLLSQSDMTHAGVISMSVRRWSNACPAMTQKGVMAALDELQRARFVFYDEETEEVLVRSMLRRDGAWRSFKTLAPAVAAARSIMSPKLRGELASEVWRLDPGDLPEPSETAKVDNKARVTALLDELRATLGPPPATPPEGVSEGVSEGPSTKPRKGYAKPLPIGTGVGVGVGASNPVVTSAGAASDADEAKPPKQTRVTKQARGHRLPDDWQPNETDRAYAESKGIRGPHLDCIAEEFRNYWHAESGQRARKVDWSATWRNRVIAVAERNNVHQLPRAANGFDINSVPMHERWRYM